MMMRHVICHFQDFLSCESISAIFKWFRVMVVSRPSKLSENINLEIEQCDTSFQRFLGSLNSFLVSVHLTDVGRPRTLRGQVKCGRVAMGVPALIF